MRFGRTLKKSIYEPWKDYYIDYKALKKLLRESDVSDQDSPTKQADGGRKWTEEDEGAFVEELINVQLEKVNNFQVDTYKRLRDRTSECESTLEARVSPAKADKNNGEQEESTKQDGQGERKQAIMKEVLEELDSITKEMNELEKYSRINFTGFLKAAKKHDRKRGSNYRVKPLLQVRLAALPFNSEDYSPLLYRLSAMYSFIRQNLDGASEDRSKSLSESQSSRNYKSYKCMYDLDGSMPPLILPTVWVHPENLLEVKTYILRRLPVLVYNPQTSRIAEASQSDPTITSLYFDNPSFSLYMEKVDRASDVSSLRLRWFGQLRDKLEIMFEKKTIREGGDNEEIRFPIKDKYVQSFLKGEYQMEKSVSKLQARQDTGPDAVEHFQINVDEIKRFIQGNSLQPVLRANYTRTAFQIPGDDMVRISLDTELAFIREDSLDPEHPCRDPDQWHRSDIDEAGMEYPFTGIKKGQVSRFPFALLEIKVKDAARKRTNEWVAELMSSHLVKEAPRFSKFVHGVAQLFEDHVNSFPFWLSEAESDIRKDPEIAFEEEQDKKAKKAEDEIAVGSLFGSKSSPVFKPAKGSPVGKSFLAHRDIEDNKNLVSSKAETRVKTGVDHVTEEDDSNGENSQASREQSRPSTGFRALFPSFSTSKYARAHREGRVKLPPGVRHPGQLIKDSGPVKVEPKVWLANQRTFIKWQHVSLLLASLSLGLYNAAGESQSVARSLAIVYTLIAVFAGAWGWWMYVTRSRMIQERSGKDFDNIVGPVAVCMALIVALCLDFALKVRSILLRHFSNTKIFL